MQCPESTEHSVTSAVRPSMKNVPRTPVSSRSSARTDIPHSEDENRGPVPEPRSMDPAATLPGIGMFASRSASTVK